ncbi:hypothetical protein SDC9_159920 [bioreactor metagenome]|uniref:Uncharacterized protein n=1 Tax=bioreactor metagenome TaxID=1076179 RepID=A0A645FGI8_9ZZZZ
MIGEDDLCQRMSRRKRQCADRDHTVGNPVRCRCFACRIDEESFSGLIKQNTIKGRKGWVIFSNRDASNLFKLREKTLRDRCYC